jgi:hypothetical protein
VRTTVVSDMTARRTASGEESPSGQPVGAFLGLVQEELVGRFISNPPPLYDGNDITFYEAVRRAAGLDPELGLIAWKNHEVLREALDSLYLRLDWALIQLGGNGRAEPWALHADRTETDVIALLAAATDPACPVVAVDIPHPEKRLLPPGVGGVGKFRGAIVAQLALLRTMHGEYGVLIDRMLSQSQGRTDRELLRWADGLASGAEVDRGPFPAKLSKVAGKWLGGYSAGTMAKFFEAVSDDWSPYSDAEAMDLLKAFDLSGGVSSSQWSEDSILQL